MSGMKIQVLGSGCPACKKLYGLTKDSVAELGIKAEVEYITDIQKLIEMGVMRSPAIAIDAEIVSAGAVPDKARIKEMIKRRL